MKYMGSSGVLEVIASQVEQVYDPLYIRKQSFWLDLRLIFLSFWIGLRGKWETRGKKM